MSATWTDPFTRADGAGLGSIPASTYTLALPWEVIAGTWSISTNRASTSTAPGSNPIVAINTGKRLNGMCDQDVSIVPVNFYGVAVYARLVDASNWIRCRSNVVQGSYYTYTTEYEYTPRTRQYTYTEYNNEGRLQPWSTVFTLQNRILQRQVSYFNGTCTNGGFTGWVNQGSPTACRSSAPATPSPVYGSWCGTQTKAYRYVSAGTTGCAVGNQKYQLQVNNATETPNYSNKWVNDGYTLQANESFTGSTQYVNSGSTYTSSSNTSNGTTIILVSQQYGYGGVYYVALSTAQTYPTSIGALGGSGTYHDGTTRQVLVGDTVHSTTKTNTTDKTYVFVSSSDVVAGSNYWATSASGPYDTATGASRQVNPVLNYTYNYYLTLEKNVAGTITQLGSTYDHGGSLTELRLKCVGSTIQVYNNGGGTVRISATDAAHRTTGVKCGFGGGPSSYNPIAPIIDSFTATMVNPLKVKNAGGTVVEGKRRVRIGAQWVDVG